MGAASLPLIGLLLALVLAPFAVKWMLRQRHAASAGLGGDLRLVSAMALGPQQRVVTVEAGPPEARVWLVLGVTAAGISTLHTAPVASLPPPAADAPQPPAPLGAGTGFAQRLAHFKRLLP